MDPNISPEHFSTHNFHPKTEAMIPIGGARARKPSITAIARPPMPRNRIKRRIRKFRWEKFYSSLNDTISLSIGHRWKWDGVEYHTCTHAHGLESTMSPTSFRGCTRDTWSTWVIPPLPDKALSQHQKKPRIKQESGRETGTAKNSDRHVVLPGTNHPEGLSILQNSHAISSFQSFHSIPCHTPAEKKNRINRVHSHTFPH